AAGGEIRGTVAEQLRHAARRYHDSVVDSLQVVDLQVAVAILDGQISEATSDSSVKENRRRFADYRNIAFL
ncbi:MAG: hypothetical protein ACK6EB_37435, partial [Planctomyces sp.]